MESAKSDENKSSSLDTRRPGNPEIRGSSSSKISILSRPFIDRGIEPAAITSRLLADSTDKLNIERQPRGLDDACIDALGIRTRTRIGTHPAFPTTAISTVIIGEGRKKEFAKHAWVFQRYDAYTAFNLFEKDPLVLPSLLLSLRCRCFNGPGYFVNLFKLAEYRVASNDVL